MKAKTKKSMYQEMKNNLANNCKVFADSAGRFLIATSYGIKVMPKQLQSMVSDQQAESALSQDRINYANTGDYDSLTR